MLEKIPCYTPLSKLLTLCKAIGQTSPPGWTVVSTTQHGESSLTVSFNVEVSEHEVCLNLRWVSKGRLNYSLNGGSVTFESVADLRAQLVRLARRARSPRRSLASVPYGRCWLPHGAKARRESFYLGSLKGMVRGRRTRCFAFAITPAREPLALSCNAVFDKEVTPGWLPADFFDKVLDALPHE